MEDADTIVKWDLVDGDVTVVELHFGRVNNFRSDEEEEKEETTTVFFPWSEIINSDKTQAYNGLDITTNKVTLHSRRKQFTQLLLLLLQLDHHGDISLGMCR